MNKGMDVEELEKCLRKIHLFQKQENLLLDDIDKTIENLNYYYSSNNRDKFDEINFLVSEKIRTIKKTHYDNITIMYKNIERYKDVLFKVQTNFNSIGV